MHTSVAGIYDMAKCSNNLTPAAGWVAEAIFDWSGARNCSLFYNEGGAR